MFGLGQTLNHSKKLFPNRDESFIKAKRDTNCLFQQFCVAAHFIGKDFAYPDYQRIKCMLDGDQTFMP